MAAAAYIGGPESLRNDKRWSDKVAFVLRQRLDRPPRPDEIADPSEDVARAATSGLLRQLHAERAEGLVEASWPGSDGTPYMLLEDSSLREAYGPTIGLIARSHWWTTTAVGKRFTAELGAPSGCPPEWTVRPIVLACFLRLADACHLDASRAPRFLAALRRPGPESAPHWDFQARLAQPYRKGDRLVFTSSPFRDDEAPAWWLCADTLRVIDQELRSVDALLTDRGEQRLAVRGVAGAEDPGRLAELLPTDDWIPVDARIRVSDMVNLVRQLGGYQLYGRAPHVPLRELMQNAADAIRARRALEMREDDWGRMVVRFGTSDEASWLEVEDTGVGMSPDVLVDHLLDFGRSFWGSEAVMNELPGLLATGFESTGRFGIGFFSVFMWSDRITVASRRHDASTGDTHVLEFRQGLGRRPILRLAHPGEQLVEAGTRVRVQVDQEQLWRLGFGQGNPIVDALYRLCAWIAPAVDVTLQVESPDGERETVVAAGDWRNLRLYKIAERVRHSPIRTGEPNREKLIHGRKKQPTPRPPDWPDPEPALLGGNGRPLKASDGSPAGRALIDPIDVNGGVVTVGGFTAGHLKGITGVVAGDPATAARHKGVPFVSASSLAEWASEQADLIAPKVLPNRAFAVAQIVRACGGATGQLAIATIEGTWFNEEELRAWLTTRQQVVPLSYSARIVSSQPETIHCNPIRTSANVAELFDAGPLIGLDRDSGEGASARAWRANRTNSLLGLVLETIDAAWGTTHAGRPGGSGHLLNRSGHSEELIVDEDDDMSLTRKMFLGRSNPTSLRALLDDETI
jgi:hypothetical protein